MAIYYLDVYNGNDSDNGLTISTPKLSMYSVTGLLSSESDEIRVRGFDNHSTSSLGNIWWIKGTTSLTGSTDMTGSLSVGDYIYKSTDTTPSPYKITGLNFTGGVMTIGINVYTGYYYGSDTVFCGVKKLNLPGSEQPNQIPSKAGYTSGGTYGYKTVVSGGWNSNYTSNTNGYTTLYENGASGLRIYCQNGGGYEFKNFILIGGGRSLWDIQGSNWTNIVGICWGSGMWNAYYGRITNCSFYKLSGPHSDGGFYTHSYNSNFYGGENIDMQSSTGNYWENCRITNILYWLQNANQSTYIGCYIYYSGPYAFHWGNSSSFFSGCTYEDCTTIWMYTQNAVAINNNLLGTSPRNLGIVNGRFINCGITTINTPFNTNYESYYITDKTISSFTYPTTNLLGTAPLLNYPLVNITLKDNVNNMIWYNLGALTTQSGDTQSGTTAMKIVQFTSSECTVGSCDFFVLSGTSYQIKFYTKSSNNQNYSWNLYYFDSELYSTWKTGSTTSTGWTEVTYNIDGSLFTANGSIRLFFRMTSGSGHYLLVSNISLI